MTKSPQQLANKVVLTVTFAAVAFVAGYSVRHTVSSFLLSFVIAYLLDPVVTYLEHKGTRRLYGILLLYVVLGILAFFCIAYLIPFITIRWESLVRNLPVYVQKIKEIILSMQSRFQPDYGMEEWRWVLDTATGNIDSIISNFGSGFYNMAGKMAFNLFNLVLAPILVFFMLFYKEVFSTGFISWLPNDWREAILSLGREINDSIGGYIRGQLVVSFIVAIMSTISLFILDVDYAALNGIFAGLASILPFIGVIIAMLPALLFALIKFQSGIMLLKVVASFAVIYFVEGYLVKPLVFKKSMDLNPLVTIIAVMAFGELFGFWGILLAIPITAAGKIFALHLRHGDFKARGHANGSG